MAGSLCSCYLATRPFNYPLNFVIYFSTSLRRGMAGSLRSCYLATRPFI
jgi:hypothetical protein